MEKVLPESVPTPHLSGPLSLHELQRLFEQAPFGIGVFDREFRCRGVNASFAERSGLPQADHVGKTLFEISPAQAPLLAPLLQQLRHGAAQADVELDDMEATHSAPPRRWRLSCSPVLDDDGIFNGLFLIMRELVPVPRLPPECPVFSGSRR